MSGPSRLRVSAGESVTLYRVLNVESSVEPLGKCFQSRKELGRPPRQAEVSSPWLYDGISCFRTLEAANSKANEHNLGRFIGRVVLLDSHGAEYADTLGPQHVTVWCDAVTLAGAVADIIPVVPNPRVRP